MDQIQLSRKFQLWRYEVGHSMLWLISQKNLGYETRMSLVFKPVQDLCLPSMMFINSVKPEAQGREHIRYAIDGYAIVYDTPTGKFVRDESADNPPRFVIAITHNLIEDDLEYHEPISMFSESI